MRLTHQSRNKKIIWAAASLLSLLYFTTSLVVVINSFVWMATFPALWYSLQKVIYWPFQPYWDLSLTVLGGGDISYQTYALLSRLPFLIVPLLVWIGALRSVLAGRSGKKQIA